MYRDHWNNVPEPDVIPLNISNKESTDNDYFSGPNAE